MPEVFRDEGYRYFFFSNEGDPREPVHLHVRKGNETAKFWLEPSVALSYNHGFRSNELRSIEETIVQHEGMIREKWHDFFGD